LNKKKFQVMDVGLLKQHLAKQHQQTGAATSHKEAVKGEGHLCPDCGKKCQYLSELEIHMAIQVKNAEATGKQLETSLLGIANLSL
jgi:uncharacterized protein with PIN domain